MLTQTRLRQAVALAEQGSFRRAARTLGVSQPALTRGIQSLEASLGAQLFDRRSTSVTLTQFGELVIGRIKAMLATEADLRRDIALMRGLDTGTSALRSAHTQASFRATPPQPGSSGSIRSWASRCMS